MQPSLQAAVRTLQAQSQTLERKLAMNCKLRRHLAAFVAIALLVIVARATADTISWDVAGSGAWDIATTANWTADGGGRNDNLYADGDAVTFANAAGGTITIQAGGVSPLSTTVSAASGTYIFAGGNLGGAGGLSKSGAGTLQIGQSYTGLVYTGNTQISGGVLRIDHNSMDGHPSNRSLAGTTVLDGGTLRFQHTGAGHYNPVLTFTSPITVTANGGTIDFAGGANNFNTNTLSAPTLGGDLTVTGVTGTPSTNGSPYNFTSGTLTLTTNAKITNDTTKPAGNPHMVVLSPNMSGSAYTLTLAKAGTGGGFGIFNATSTSINLGGIAVGDGSSLYISSGNAINPLSQIKTNGGLLTMGVGSSLIFQGNGSANGAIYDASAVAWQGNGTLTFALQPGGNGDTYVRISNANLVVSSASGLTTFNAEPKRGYYTVDSPYAIVVGAGGTMNWTTGQSTAVRETVRGNVTFLGGATIVGINTGGFPAGIIRDTTSGGTLTLGDGSASVVTIQGNHGADTDSFNIGFAANTTDNGGVTMKYANTSSTAGTYFNVGWSNGGTSPHAAPLVAFKESSGGTEFAPIAGSGGVAILGADVGTVATFARSATLSTTGIVGFYNEVNTNQRGALGAVQIGATGSFALLAAGTMQASSLTTISGSTLSGIGTFDVPTIAVGGSVEPGNSIGILTMGTLLNPTTVTFASGGELVIEMQGDGVAGVDYDVLVVNGNVVFEPGAVLTLAYLNVYTPGAVSSWDILQASGTVTGFGLLELPAKHVLSFNDGVLTLTLIPEPTAGLLLACGGLLALRRRQRRA